MTPTAVDTEMLISLTTEIVISHVSNNPLDADDIPVLIQTVHAALVGLSASTAEAAKPEPAVPIRSSVKPDHLVCLEDGKKLKMLKRYLMTNYQMTPAEYRERWGLPADYPMVAPAYADKRRELAKKFGLGRTPGQRRGRQKAV